MTGMTNPYRNLIDGIGYGIALFLGAVVGVHCTTPIVNSLPPASPYSTPVVLAGYVVGMIVGGGGWKLFLRWRRARRS